MTGGKWISRDRENTNLGPGCCFFFAVFLEDVVAFSFVVVVVVVVILWLSRLLCVMPTTADDRRTKSVTVGYTEGEGLLVTEDLVYI